MELPKAKDNGTDATGNPRLYGTDALGDRAAIQALTASLEFEHRLVDRRDISPNSSHPKTTDDRPVLAFA
ncbi:hypothetical protein [Haloarcula litorea]|uniref:hypothetical protein n=1 Tax=Haloarcula litorea TaxID=3032579 RepID=UPI0023E7D51B|nr:hypothetical protein [Halomicroarcula sp. GDY20]